MVNDTAQTASWLSSGQTRKLLRISSCALMHLRETGKLRFQKQGNAYFYFLEDVERHRKDHSYHVARARPNS